MFVDGILSITENKEFSKILNNEKQNESKLKIGELSIVDICEKAKMLGEEFFWDLFCLTQFNDQEILLKVVDVTQSFGWTNICDKNSEAFLYKAVYTNSEWIAQIAMFYDNQLEQELS